MADDTVVKILDIQVRYKEAIERIAQYRKSIEDAKEEQKHGIERCDENARHKDLLFVKKYILEHKEQGIEYIQEHISPDATFEYHDTICRQVANRMPNIRKFAASHDLVFFVCGRKSSNGKILYHECKKVNENTHLIDQPEEIDQNLLEGVKSIGICGATSTPKWLMEECKNKILNH